MTSGQDSVQLINAPDCMGKKSLLLLILIYTTIREISVILLVWISG